MDTNKTPDSMAHGYLEIEVFDTPEHDNPAYGSVTVRMRQTQYSSQVVRMSLVDANELQVALLDYLDGK